MSEDQFTKLFKYMEDFRKEVNEQLEKNRQEHIDIRGAIADLGVQIKDYHQELLMLGNKVDRLERWINQIAQETGVKLDYS